MLEVLYVIVSIFVDGVRLRFLLATYFRGSWICGPVVWAVAPRSRNSNSVSNPWEARSDIALFMAF